MTVAPSTTLTARETLDELRERGYALILNTKVQEIEAKVGLLYLTVASTLSVRGSEAPPDYLRAAMHRYGTELKAAVAVSDPPVEWMVELVRRCRTGYAHTAMRNGQEARFPITLEVLCANLASFLGIDPIEEVEMIREIVREELSNTS